MKNFLTIYLVIAICFFSCQKDKSTYSCDPDVNLWVKKNLSEIRQMKSTEISKLDPVVRVAVFRAFSAKQRLDVWINRIDQLLILQWTEMERAHLLNLRNSLTIDRFTDEITSDTEKFKKITSYEKEWVIYAINKLGWAQDMIGNMFARIDNTYTDTETLKNGNITPNVAIGTTCSCSSYDDYCPGSGSCVTGGCTTSAWGCGFLFGYMCNGKCTLF